MSKPIKLNADWFKHKTTMHTNRKIVAGMNKFGVAAYAVYNMMLEYLASRDYFVCKWDAFEIELLAGAFHVDALQLTEIVDYYIKLNLFTVDSGLLHCPKLTGNLSQILTNRDNDRKRKTETRSDDAGGIPDGVHTENQLFHSENPIVHTENTTEQKESKNKNENKNKNTFSKEVNTIPKCDDETSSLTEKFIIPSLLELRKYIAETYPHIENVEAYSANYYEKRIRSKWKKRDGTAILDWRTDLASWVYWDKTEKLNEVCENGINSRNSKIAESDFSGVQSGFQ